MGEAALKLPDELRRALRKRVLKEGRIVIRRGWSLINCAIRNISETGACISLTEAECEVPKEFDLLFVNESQLVPCEIRWRKGERLGLRFTAPARRAPAYRL
jgi:hypothetical protein